jgi:AAA family ATP:ADP antiporter
MNAIKRVCKNLFDVSPQERLKVFFLSLTFFLIIGAYTITRDLKSSIFVSVVGQKKFTLVAKFLSMILLLPLLYFYSRMVDRMRRYQLLSVCSAFFGTVGLLFAYYIGHVQVGIGNTAADPSRFFGWLFYFFIEAYSPFVVSVFWAFANSITTPDNAKKNYGFIVSGSKLGGMMTAGLAWYLFSISAKGTHPYLNDVITHQIILVLSSVMVLLVPVVIFFLMKLVPGQYLHGYEAAYQLEKQKDKQEPEEKMGMFAGLSMFVKYPYVFGIFGLVFFYEFINAVLGYLRLGMAEANSENISGMSSTLFEIMFKTHAIGLVISLFGTRFLQQKLGTSFCLLLIPLLTGIFLLYLMVNTTSEALIHAFVLFKAIHYTLSWPVRESLYIPTVKEIKFKSRAWTDAFGSKIARSSGAIFNWLTSYLGTALVLPIHSFFFALIIGLWFVTALLLGRRFEKAVKNNEVIGAENS